MLIKTGGDGARTECLQVGVHVDVAVGLDADQIGRSSQYFEYFIYLMRVPANFV